MCGWIKLHRGLLDWEWYDDVNVRLVFIHLILKANHKNKNYKGQLIERGQLVAGREQLSSEIGLKVQQVRTALNKLKSTSDITIKSTSKGMLVTITNYGLYQDDSKKVTIDLTSTLTSEQPATNQQLTTNKNVRSKECKKKDISTLQSFEDVPAVAEFPLNDGSRFYLHADQIEKWIALYPAVDVYQQLRNISGWLDSNVNKRKTRNGFLRFVNNWLSREQNTPKMTTSSKSNGVNPLDESAAIDWHLGINDVW